MSSHRSLHLGDDVINELGKLRSEYNVSYTGAIRLLLQRDIRLLLINRRELRRVVLESRICLNISYHSALLFIDI